MLLLKPILDVPMLVINCISWLSLYHIEDPRQEAAAEIKAESPEVDRGSVRSAAVGKLSPLGWTRLSQCSHQ